MFRKHGYLILVILLFAVGAFLRLYNFENRLIFGPEQAISLLTSASYLEKFSLLGEVNLQRVTSTGLNPFHGALFNYFLVPFILLFKFNPLPISYFFLFFNIFTALIFFLVTKKLFGKNVALFSLFYFLFSSKMIHHSLFIWNLNFLPLLGTLSLWFISKQIKKPKNIFPSLWLGLLGGIGFGLQYLYLPFILFTLFLSIYISKKKIQTLFLFGSGLLIGAFSMVLFDLRHEFYYTRTLWQYFLDVLQKKANGGVCYFDFMYLFPYLFIIYGFITNFIYKKWKFLCLIPLLIYTYVSFQSPQVNFNRSTGVVEGINLYSLQKASAIIAKDNPPERFNVVTLWDFDSRAHTLRYFLKYYYKMSPQSVEEYKNVDALYVFAPSNYDINEPKVYELNAYTPYKIRELDFVTSGFRLYKLTK